ncbi:MAG: hypothetical protein JNK23_08325 [Opitutaceae bacterium]|nr:hypothetical protein [Opitutaceae bacterium]
MPATESIPDLNFVTPVYLDDKGTLLHLGSAVLIRSTESYWLLTAAHVAADGELGTVLLPRATGGFFRLTGYPVSSCPLRREDAYADCIDLFCVALNDLEAAAVGTTGVGFLPLHPDTVDLRGEIPAGSFGVLWGFPTPSVTISQRHATIAPAFFDDLKFAEHERIRRAGLDPDQNLALIAPRKFVRNGIVQHDFQLKGLSGGAILRSDPDGLRLVGIATEFRDERSLLVGTRIGHLFASVAHHLKSGAPIRKIMTTPVVHPTMMTVELAVAKSGADKNRFA